MKTYSFCLLGTTLFFLLLFFASIDLNGQSKKSIESDQLIKIQNELKELKTDNDSIKKSLLKYETIKESMIESKKNVYDSYDRSYKAIDKISDVVLWILGFVLISLIGGVIGYITMLAKIKKHATKEINYSVEKTANSMKSLANKKLGEIGLDPDKYDLNFQEIINKVNLHRKILELDFESTTEIALSYFIGKETDDNLVIQKIFGKISTVTNKRHKGLCCIALIVSKTSDNIKQIAKDAIKLMANSQDKDEAGIGKSMIEKLKDYHGIVLN
jgi:hypothetical protein